MFSSIAIEDSLSNLILIIRLHTIKRFQLLLFNISNSVYQIFLRNTNNLHKAVWIQKTTTTNDNNNDNNDNNP